MARRSSGAILTLIRLDRHDEVTLAQQLENQLRDAILSGALASGSQLPSSRTLAAELGVSRPTVIVALEGLGADGFLEMRHGAGTFVANALPSHLPPAARQKPLPGAQDGSGRDGSGQVSEQGGRLRAISADIGAHEAKPFLPNTPAYDHFPFALWQKCVSQQTRRSYRGNMGYEEPKGYAPLRQSIAAYLALHRGDDCDPEQIVITPGAHAAFMLAAQVLTNPGDGILFEDPGPFIARHMFQSLGRRLIAAGVDNEGMDFDAVLAANPETRMAFVMPSRQHPLGCTLSVTRRLKLMHWAVASDGWIVEDDYDSEFRYTGRPLPSMHSIDRSERVIYVGTFSKSLFPALRIGYLVLPPALVGLFRNAVALMFRCAPLFSQVVLAEFITDGHFATHLRRMRELYATRRDQFLATVQEVSGGHYRTASPDSGMNAVLWLPEGLDDREIARRANIAGIHGYPLSDYYMQPDARPGLLLGFTNVAQHQLRPGLETLARVIAGARD